MSHTQVIEMVRTSVGASVFHVTMHLMHQEWSARPTVSVADVLLNVNSHLIWPMHRSRAIWCQRETVLAARSAVIFDVFRLLLSCDIYIICIVFLHLASVSFVTVWHSFFGSTIHLNKLMFFVHAATSLFPKVHLPPASEFLWIRCSCQKDSLTEHSL